MNVFKKLIIVIVITMLIACSSDDPTIPPPEGFDVTLAWDPNSEPNVIGYAVWYRHNLGESYEWATSINSDDPLLVKLNFKKDQAIDWYFVVTAYSITKESGYSNEVKYTP